MHLIGVWALSAALSLATAQDGAGAQQFDLICEGSAQRSLDGPEEPRAYRLRIDLASGRYCWSDCVATFAIQEVAPDHLILSSENVDTYRERVFGESRISRATGVHDELSIRSRPAPGRYYRSRATCTKGDFTGFPATLF